MFSDNDYKEFNTEKEADEFIRHVYGDYSRKYREKQNIIAYIDYKYRSDGAAKPMEYYTGCVYDKINTYMREGRSQSKDDIYNYDMLIDKINELIYLAPKPQENIVVYRSVDDYAIGKIMEQVDKYGKYCEPAFMSTSLLLDTAKKFGKNILKLMVPGDAHALGVDCISGGEQEMLFAEKQWLSFVNKHTYEQDSDYTIYEFKLEVYNPAP